MAKGNPFIPAAQRSTRPKFGSKGASAKGGPQWGTHGTRPAYPNKNAAGGPMRGPMGSHARMPAKGC